MFHGPTGCGKTTFARIIKQELECSDDDFVELNAANTRGIDTVREVIQSSSFSSFTGGVRIFLFDECHKLSSDAGNALLKILEDTPRRVYFILCTTDPEKVLKTIRNRCTIFSVSKLQSFVISSLLERICKAEKKELDKGILREISRVCVGSPRQALVLLEQVFDLDQKDALEVLRAVQIGEAKVISIINLLLKPKSSSKWVTAAELIEKLEDSEPEQIRVAILNYLAKVILGKEGVEAKRISEIMQFFTESFLYGGKGKLVLSIFKATEI
jgi:DNA polymerase-3 subunit gamma/tau